MAEPRGRALRLGAAAILLAAACEPAPSPIESAAQGSVVATESAAVPETPTPAAPSIDPGAIDLHFLDARHAPGDRPISANGQVLWAAGAESLPELWRFVPGNSEPERIYVSPHGDASIGAIVASSAGYAFVEGSNAAYGEGGWRLWFLPAPGQEPIEVDHGSAPGAGVAPTIAMDSKRIAWAAFDEPPAGPRSRLRVAPIAQLESVTTLFDTPIEERKLWYPVLAGQELWYATIKPGIDEDDEFHIESIDLGRPGAAPVRFEGRGNDFNLAVTGEFLAWKTTKPGDAALNWGTLRVLDRRSGVVRTIPVENADRPSLGDRFVSFDEMTHRSLAVYDLETNQLLVLARADDATLYAGESLSGDLLTFFRQDGVAPPRIGWAILPG